ncbi:MAG: hypothetical protein FJ293_14660 [Planctomycetes bacterium]|nr:hypothetical protein [Planctomycetota bacterium]
MKRGKGGANGSGLAVAPALDPVEARAEADGWFTVSRAAWLLDWPLPRVFDAIRDARLQVRFEPGRPGEPDKPRVTSAELVARAAKAIGRGEASMIAVAGSGAGERSTGSERTGVAAAAAAVAVPGAAPAAAVAAAPAPNEELVAVRSQLVESEELLEQAEQRLDASLKAVYERDVRIARLEAEVAAHQKMREESDGFIRHLEARLDKTEDRSEEKEKEIRRLAVGLGEARGEIRLLKPPEAPPAVWKQRVEAVAIAGIGAVLGAALGWFSWRLATEKLSLEAGLAAGIGVAIAWIAGAMTDRLRRGK